MQWRIINDRRAIVGMSCDKLASKEYAREVALSAGVNLEVPTTYWVGTDVRELQAMAGNLPVRWVLKPNHTSGRYALIDADRSAVDWERLQSLGQKWIQRDEEELGLGHWGYSVARHLLFAEERIGSHESPTTIRGFTTNGEPRWFNADVGFKPNKRRWRHNAGFERFHGTSDADRSTGIPSPIEQLGDTGRATLRGIVSALGREFDFQRCDLFVHDGRFWFGEFSTYAQGGIGRSVTARDEAVASTWTLPRNGETPSERQRFWSMLQASPRLG